MHAYFMFDDKSSSLMMCKIKTFKSTIRVVILYVSFDTLTNSKFYYNYNPGRYFVFKLSKYIH